MFKAKVFASRFRDKLKEYFDLVVNDGDAIQIVHRGEKEPIRVLVTQDHYINLITKIGLYEAQLNINDENAGIRRTSRDDTIKRLKKRREDINQDMKIYGESIAK